MAVTLLAEIAVKILVLGTTGLLGNAVFRSLSTGPNVRVHGTIRREADRGLFAPGLAGDLSVVEDIEKPEQIARLFDVVCPEVIINCVAPGRPAPADPMRSIMIYSLLPRRLSDACRRVGARLIQISSDGVFSGLKGGYTEDDFPDASDVYGIAKLLGEVLEPHAITLRTSIVGHELQSRSGLLEWFLSQQDQCRCYTRAIFSGFPTIVLADLIRDVVIPRPDLHGVYHVASRPISKFDLMRLVAERYGKDIELIPDERANPDRTLVATRFERATGYVAPDWPTLVDQMYSDHLGSMRT